MVGLIQYCQTLQFTVKTKAPTTTYPYQRRQQLSLRQQQLPAVSCQIQLDDRVFFVLRLCIHQPCLAERIDDMDDGRRTQHEMPCSKRKLS